MTKCKKCYHPCHCEDGIHADEYGMCVCDNCKCGNKRTYKKQIEHATDMTYENEHNGK
jgi:hypothetical protein